MQLIRTDGGIGVHVLNGRERKEMKDFLIFITPKDGSWNWFRYEQPKRKELIDRIKSLFGGLYLSSGSEGNYETSVRDTWLDWGKKAHFVSGEMWLNGRSPRADLVIAPTEEKDTYGLSIMLYHHPVDVVDDLVALRAEREDPLLTSLGPISTGRSNQHQGIPDVCRAERVAELYGQCRDLLNGLKPPITRRRLNVLRQYKKLILEDTSDDITVLEEGIERYSRELQKLVEL